ncbi:MAG: glucoamylase [Candidatus Saccharimonadales bacterium]|jgi:glucoamylase
MARPVFLGNGGLTVGLDESGMVHDFYFPYVGLENLTSARSNPHYVGIWVDGKFSWINEQSWEKDINFRDDALVSKCELVNSELGVALLFEDFVVASADIFARKVTIRNMSENDREIRMFFHQVVEISAQGRADTALYEPDNHYILDYKGRVSLLIYAEDDEGKPFDQHAVGNTGIEGKEGTFRDAEDGELSGSSVEHASVDSTIRCSVEVEANGSRELHYWIAASDSQDDLERMHKTMLGNGFDSRMKETVNHWEEWLNISVPQTKHVPEKYMPMLRKSLMIIKAHTDEHGGIIASCDSSIYNYGRDYYSYVWPRDGALSMWPLIKLGYTEEPKKFFEFCASIIHKDGYLRHKYQPDQAVGSTWHPIEHGNSSELAIQEDETALVVFMLGEYLKYSEDEEFVQTMYEKLVKPACSFMASFIDEDTKLPHATYDLWEEKFLTSTFSTSVVCRALAVGADLAAYSLDLDSSDTWWDASKAIETGADKLFSQSESHHLKGFLNIDGEIEEDTTLDISSFYGAYKFGYGTHQQLLMTLRKIESELLDISPSGGSARYADDAYFRSEPAFKGNPWYVTTLWLAQYYADCGDREKAYKYVDWAISNSTNSGVLSEQINPTDSSIVGVAPLVWSHAELINTLL